MPVAGIVPVGTVDHGIDADAAQRGTMLDGQRRLDGHVAYPGAAPAAHVARFGQQQRPLVARLHFQQQLVQGHAARFAQVPPQAQVAAAFPLVAVVIVQADQVQVARRAAQFRRLPAAQHVPRLELRGTPGGRLRNPVRASGRRGHVDQGIALQEARLRADGTDGVATGHGGAHQLPLAFLARIGPVHIQALEHVHGQAPAGKRDFIDGRIHGRATRIRREKLRCRPAIAGKARHEVRREQVELGRPAVVAEGPVDLQAQLLRHGGALFDERKVELAIALGQAPAYAFAHAADAELAQQQVVFAHPVQVARGAVHVQRLAAMGDMVGALVARLPVSQERRCRAIGIGHACSS